MGDVAICGGADACVTPGVIAAFSRMGVVSTKYNDNPKLAPRPFDKDRDGFVIGEGAWIFVAEELSNALKRKANIYGKIAGYGATCDAYHPSTPLASGYYTAEAIKYAIIDAGLRVEDIDYIAAYGNATRINDPYETKVIKNVFGKHAYKLQISSIKSMIGHPIGASGAAQVASSLVALRNNFLPPTVNLDHPDEECDLDYVSNKARMTKVDNILCNTLSFGGKNSSLVISRVENES